MISMFPQSQPRTPSRRSSSRRGAAAILIVFMFMSLMLLAFLAINISLMQRHQAEAQIASDLASRRGVDLLAQGDLDEDEIEVEVLEAAAANWPTFLRNDAEAPDLDIDFGSARVKQGVYSFEENATPLNSVRVVLNKEVSTFGPIARVQPTVSITRDATSAALERDICLVIDRSGSMNFDLDTGTWRNDRSKHGYNKLSMSSSRSLRNISYVWWWYWPHPTESRWSSMIPAVYQLAEELKATKQQEMLSIVTYSSDDDFSMYDHSNRYRFWDVDAADVVVKPTKGYNGAASKLDNRFKNKFPVAGATDISAGIDTAIEVLTSKKARPHAFKVMIVMTDGQFNRGRQPWLAAAEAAEAGIEVHTVTFSDQANQRDMKLTAEAGGGLHFHAPDGDSLADIFKEIAHLPAAAIID